MTPPPATGSFRLRIFLNTLSAVLGNGWSMVVMIASLPLLLDGLGKDAFGTWVLLQTFSAVTGWLSLADAGVGLAMTRLVATKVADQDRRGAAEGVGSGLAVVGAVGIACALALGVFGPRALPALFDTPSAIVDDLRTATTFFAVSVFGELLIRGISAGLEGFQRVDISRGLDALRRTAVAIATIATAQLGGGLAGVAAASAAATAATVVVAFLALRVQLRNLGSSTLTFRSGAARSLLRYGSTVGALNATGVLHRSMDRLIANSVAGPGGVALVEVATQLQNGASAVLSASSYAAISSSPWLKARQDGDALRALLVRGTRYSLLASLPVIVLATIVAGPLVRIWVGVDFEAAIPLAVLALAYLGLAAPLQVGQNLLQGVGAAGLVLRAAVLSVAVNLAASLLLAQVYGLRGILVGTLLGVMVLIPQLTRATLRTTSTTGRVFLRRAIVPAVLATIPMAIVAQGVRSVMEKGDVVELFVAATCGVAAYVPAALRWGVEARERELVVERLRRWRRN